MRRVALEKMMNEENKQAQHDAAPLVTVDTPEFVTAKDALIDAGVRSTISGASCDVQSYLAAEDHFIEVVSAHTASAVAAAVEEACKSCYIHPAEICIVGRANDGKTPDIDLPIFGDGSKDGKRLFVVALPAQQPDSGRDAALIVTDIKDQQFREWCSRNGMWAVAKELKAYNEAIAIGRALAAHPAPSSDAAQGVWVGTISSGDIEGDEIDWDAEFDRKVVDALPQLRVPNQHFGLFMAPLNAAHPANGAQAGAELTDKQIVSVWQEMPGGPDGWLKSFGFLQFARAILAAAKKGG